MSKYVSKYKPKEPKICPVCGKEFHPYTMSRIYCSDECLKEYHRQLNWKPPKYCAICGKELPARNRRFCGEKCSKEYKHRMRAQGAQIRKRKKGEGELSPLSIAAMAAKVAGLSYGNFSCLDKKEQNRLIAKAKAMRERGEKIE